MIPQALKSQQPGCALPWSSIGRWGRGCSLLKSQPLFSSPVLDTKNTTLGLGGDEFPPSPLLQSRWPSSAAGLALQTPPGWYKSHTGDRWSFHQQHLPGLARPVCFLQTDSSAHPRSPRQPVADLERHGSADGASRCFSPPLWGAVGFPPLLAMLIEPLWEKNLSKPVDALPLFNLEAKPSPCTAQLCSGCPDTTHLDFLQLKKPLRWVSGHLSHPSGKSRVHNSVKSWRDEPQQQQHRPKGTRGL